LHKHEEAGRLLALERKNEVVVPNKENTFKAFLECPMDDVKVMFVGQDPYPKYTQATGLAFGIDINKCNPPFSLKALIQELENDLDVLALCPDYSLTSWANQGVLMLNTALTLRRGAIGSHLHIWKPVMRDLLEAISERFPDLVVVAVGKKAESSLEELFPDRIAIVHPAAEAYSGGKAGFYGCKIFSKVNQQLIEKGKDPINWIKDWKQE
jgi:uracil-DNA glycosylase